MPSTADLVAVFLALHLIAGDHPPTDAEVGWMMWAGNGDAVWETGDRLGLVKPGERPWSSIKPFNPPADHRHDLATLRARAHPVAVPMRMPGN